MEIFTSLIGQQNEQVGVGKWDQDIYIMKEYKWQNIKDRI